MLGTIVAATDGGERAGRAVTFAADLARRYSGTLTLVHVRAPGAHVPERALRAQAERAGARLELLEDERPAEAICALADRLRADAIVVGNDGMSGRKEFLLGNIPNRVSHHAGCTVIIVDTRDDKEKRRRR